MGQGSSLLTAGREWDGKAGSHLVDGTGSWNGSGTGREIGRVHSREIGREHSREIGREHSRESVGNMFGKTVGNTVGKSVENVVGIWREMPSIMVGNRIGNAGWRQRLKKGKGYRVLFVNCSNELWPPFLF